MTHVTKYETLYVCSVMGAVRLSNFVKTFFSLSILGYPFCGVHSALA